jgi:hypothetical protein
MNKYFNSEQDINSISKSCNLKKKESKRDIYVKFLPSKGIAVFSDKTFRLLLCHWGQRTLQLRKTKYETFHDNFYSLLYTTWASLINIRGNTPADAIRYEEKQICNEVVQLKIFCNFI